MKLFQKSALAVAIAAVPFLSVNAMEALDDATLSEMTGQAGVTIETTVGNAGSAAGIEIGQIVYTDTQVGAEKLGGGSVVINDIKMTGLEWDGTNSVWVDGLSKTKQTIDVDVNGNLITETTALGNTKIIDGVEATGQLISIGSVRLRSQVQQGLDNVPGADYVANKATGAELVGNLSMIMESGNSQAHILNLSGDAADAAAAVATYLDVAETDHRIAELGSTTTIEDGLNKAVAGKAGLAIVTKSSSRISNLNVDALDSAIGVRGLTYGGGADGSELMQSTQVIWAKGGDAENDADAGVFIQGSASKGTLIIDGLHIGGSKAAIDNMYAAIPDPAITGNAGLIGSLTIRDISQAGTVTRIYGH